MRSRTELTEVVDRYIEDHNCNYAKRLRESEAHRQLGSYGLSIYTYAAYATELVNLHENDTPCPPTHVNTSPTKEWADWVDQTRF